MASVRLAARRACVAAPVTVSMAVRAGVAVLAVIAVALLGSPAAAHASTAATRGVAAAATPTPAVNPGGSGPSAAPTTAPQSTICDGLAIVGMGGLCQAGSQVVSSLNDLCSPGPPSPEPAGGGIDAMIRPPAAGVTNAPRKLTLYQSYGMAGQSWAPYNLKCSDMTSMVGNSVANTVFDGAKAVDRITITTYQSAANEGLLGWLKQRVDQLITQIGNAVYFPYLAPIVLLGALWMAWQGLIRKRATRTLEGTIWMVLASVTAIWLIGRPADFTGVGAKVSDGISQVLNAAFSRLPVSGGTSCVPVGRGDPQSTGENYAYTSGNEVVSQNADELWAVLACKPWLAGEFGTMSTAGDTGGAVSKYGRALLWSQAFAVNERPTQQLATQKQDVYQGVAKNLEQDPAVYPVFQGKQWATRLEIAFAALFAALVAGALVLLIAVTLIVLKLGFLLLLVAGPFFLIVGTHPGFGRVIAIRWFEMLLGVLMKQGAVALTLSVLLYCYALVMGVSDNALPWVFKIMMIALLTVAVFIYRRPFQHLFASVGYDMVGARERAEAYRDQARYGFRGQSERAATAVVPGYSSYRVARWARRNPQQADQAAFLAQSIARATGAGPNGQGPADSPNGDGGPDPNGSSPGGASRPGGARLRSDIGGGAEPGRREPPPLDLPRRQRGPLPRWQSGPHAQREGVPPLSLGGPAGGAGTPQRARPPGQASSHASGPAAQAPSRSASSPHVPASPASRPQPLGHQPQRRQEPQARLPHAQARQQPPAQPRQQPPVQAAPQSQPPQPPRASQGQARPAQAPTRSAPASTRAAPAKPAQGSAAVPPAVVPPPAETESGERRITRSWVRPIRRDR